MQKEPSFFIKVKGLNFFRGSTQVLFNLNLTMENAQMIAVLGPNGSGKSTFLSLLAEQTHGDIFYESKEGLVSIGYLPEKIPLYDDMTVSEYLELIGALRLNFSSSKEQTKDQKNFNKNFSQIINKRVQVMLEMQGLKNYAGSLIGQLSQGLRQRVGIAQALFHDPQVIILDEPTNGLDKESLDHFHQVLRHEKNLGKLIIFSTHQMMDVLNLADQVLVLEQGQMLSFMDAPSWIKNQLPDQFIKGEL